MNTIFLTFQIVILLLFTGYGLVSLFFPKELKKYLFWFVPWVSICYIAILASILSLTKIPMNFAKDIIFLFSFIFFILSILFRKFSFQQTKYFWFFLFFSLVILVYNLFPLVHKIGFPTVISLSNLDGLTYVNVADFLKSNNIMQGKEYIPFKPYLWSVGDFIHNNFRWGSPLVISYISGILSVDSYEVFYITMVILFTFTIPVIYFLSLRLININSQSFLLLFLSYLFFGMNSSILYILYNSFFAQLAFIGILISIIILYLIQLKRKKYKYLEININDFVIAFFISSISCIYPEGIFLTIIPIFTFTLYKLFFNKNIFFLANFLIIVLISLIINPITFGNSVMHSLNIFLNNLNTGFISWEKIRFANPVEMLGLWNMFFSKSLPSFISFTSYFIAMVVILFSLIKIKDRKFIGSYLLILFFLLFFYEFIKQDYFLYHRTLTYYLFLIVALFNIGIYFFIKQFIKNKYLTIFFLIILFLLTLRSAYRTTYQFYWHARVVDKSTVSLSDLNNNKYINKPFFTSDIYYGEYDLWDILWPEYFLKNKEMISIQNYPTDKELTKDIDLLLLNKKHLKKNNVELKITKTFWENDYYKLGEYKVIMH